MVQPSGGGPRPATPPRTPYEEAVLAIWSEVLGTSGFGVHDDFFALGGHSMLAPRIVSRVRRTLGVQIPVRDFFGCRTVAALASVVAVASSAEPRVIERRPTDAVPVLSFDQQRLWLESQLLPSLAYNVHGRRRLRGRLDLDAFTASLRTVLTRHESLRTRFPLVDGGPVPVVEDLPADWRLDVRDLSGRSGDREAAARQLADEQARTAFALGGGPLFRCLVVRLADDDHVLAITAHHIVCDDWSVGVFTRELAALYAVGGDATRAGLPELPIQYQDYAAWQRDRLVGERLEQAVGYWRTHLDGAPGALTMPAVSRRIDLRRTGGLVRTELSEAETAALRALCRAQGASPFMVLLTTLAAVLGRWSGQQDLVVGVPVAGRTDAGTDTLIGFLINTLPVRVDLSGDPTFADLLARVRQVCLDGYAHSDAPLDVLVEQLEVVRDPRRPPLFEVILNVMNHTGGDGEELRGLVSEPLELSTALPSKFDLALNLTESGQRLQLQLDFNPDRYPPRLMRTFLAHLEAMLEGAVADADRSILDYRLGPEVVLPADDAAAEVPSPPPVPAADRPAVVAPGATRTYGWLGRAVNQVSVRIPRPAHVGLVRRPSAGFVAALLACVEVGVPFTVVEDEPTVPLAYLGVTTTLDPADLDDSPAVDDAPDGDVDRPAAAVGGRLDGGWPVERWGLSGADRIAAASTRPGLLVAAVATAYTAGGTLLLPPAGVGDLGGWLRDQGATVVHLTAPQLRTLTEPMPALRGVLVENDGELLGQDVEMLRRLAPGCRIAALYRPGSDGRPRVLYEVPDDWSPDTAPLRVPLGTALPGTGVALVSPSGHPAAVGEVAELGIGSHRTGDLVRAWPDGHLELVGRVGMDRTADPVETLAELRDLPDVRDALVTEVADEDGGSILVGYVCGPDPDCETVGLRQALVVRLPEHLVPRHLVVLDELPRTPAGEYDVSALPQPDEDETDDYVAPRTPFEAQLTEIFAELLDVERIGVHDTFFELNGFSLLATQLTSRIRDTFQVELPLREVFAAPTVAGLAQLILQTQAEMSGSAELEALLSEIESLT